MTVPIPYLAEARLMRLEIPQPSYADIARRLGKESGMIRWALDENGERAQTAERVRRQRKRGPRSRAGKLHSDVAAPHQPRLVKRILADPAVKRQAVEDFAAGRIGREEMMRRITA